MGAIMARNLTDKGYSISCVNESTKRQPPPLPTNLPAHASTLAEVTAQSDIVLTVVTNDAAMESIFGAKTIFFKRSRLLYQLGHPLACNA